jgi:hypothetical protein
MTVALQSRDPAARGSPKALPSGLLRHSTLQLRSWFEISSPIPWSCARKPGSAHGFHGDVKLGLTPVVLPYAEAWVAARGFPINGVGRLGLTLSQWLVASGPVARQD